VLERSILLPPGGRTQTDVWSTPQWLFHALDREFGFTLDPCSDGANAKCRKHYTLLENGLRRDWGTETVFLNPPYSECLAWMQKAYGAAQLGATVVCLVPSRTDTEWWHAYAMKGEIRFLRRRLRFGDAKSNAPFPSAVVVFRPQAFVLTAWDPDQA
jgi:site-specific DNA-methyltransferase (adenine-specific)